MFDVDRKLRIYLAGCIYLTEYRKYVKENYNINIFEIIDPLDYEEWKSEELGEYQKIINTDLRLMWYCDILISDMSLGPTYGTASELALMHHSYRKATFVFNIKKEFINSPWLIGQSTKVFENVDDCFEYLKINYRKYFVKTPIDDLV